MRVPERYRKSAKHRALYATMLHLAKHDDVGPVSRGEHGREVQKAAVDRVRQVLESRAADAFRDYLAEEAAHVAAAVAGGRDAAQAVESLQEDLRDTYEAVLRSSARSWRRWAASRSPLVAKAPLSGDPDVRLDEWIKATAAKRVVGISETSRKRIALEIAAGTEAGETVQQIAGRVERLYVPDVSAARAEVIARTEVGVATNWAQWWTAQDSGVHMRKEWLCVAGETRVSGSGVRYVARRWYSGPLVKLRTLSGRVVTVTGQHLVLTGRGWIAAEAVHEGDDLLRYDRSVEAGVPGSGGVPDVNDVPPTIAEVFDALHDPAAACGAVSRVMHLDSKGRQSKIEVIAVNGELRDRLEPEASQFLRKKILEFSDFRLGAHFSRRSTARGFVSVAPPEPRAHEMHFSRPRLKWLVGSSHDPRFGLRSNSHSDKRQAPLDALRGGSILCSESPERSATPIFLCHDTCVAIEISPWSGHVYDYTTATGWMIANDLIIHNSLNDDRTRDDHVLADGQTVGVNQAFLVGEDRMLFPGDESMGAGPEQIISCRCVPGSTRVSARGVLAATRRLYVGELVEIVVSSGEKFTATPNHQVLGSDGWVSVGSVSKGDYLFRCLDAKRVLGGDPDVYDSPATIEEIFDSLSLAHGRGERVRSSSVDFHGDGLDGEVDIVSANDRLTPRGSVERFEHDGEFGLSAAHFGEMSISNRPSGERVVSKPQGVRLGSSAGRYSGVAEDYPDGLTLDPEQLGRFLLGHAAVVRRDDRRGDLHVAALEHVPTVAAGAHRDARVDEPSVNRHDGRADFRAHLRKSETGLVELAEVVEVKRYRFSGHVYNLHTEREWYVAENIISHNCSVLYHVTEKSADSEPEPRSPAEFALDVAGVQSDEVITALAFAKGVFGPEDRWERAREIMMKHVHRVRRASSAARRTGTKSGTADTLGRGKI